MRNELEFFFRGKKTIAEHRHVTLFFFAIRLG